MTKIKKRIFCRDCGREKHVFESEKKALKFIEWNGQEIEEQGGKRPIRSYFCQTCGGYHVTSGYKRNHNAFSNTDRIINEYKAYCLG